MREVMNPVSRNPTLLEYSLCKEFGWEPQVFDDRVVTLPSFKEVLRWIFKGKTLAILVKKGADAIKIESFLEILNEIRIEQDEKQRRIESEAKLRSGIS